MAELEKTFNDYIDSLIRPQMPKRHKFYKETVDHAEMMGVHVEGDTPKKLIDESRPNEPDNIKEYRIKVWKSVTKSFFSKVINTINRIFNPRFFMIKWPEKPKVIPDDKELSVYMLEEFGIYRSIWIFVRNTLLKKTLGDPNAVCLVMPPIEEFEDTEIKFFNPVPLIFNSEQVIDFGKNHFSFLIKAENKLGEAPKPSKLYYVDKDFIFIWNVAPDSKKTLIFELQHNLGEVPAFRLQGDVEGQKSPYWFSSFVSGIAPHWDKAVMRISDLDGSVINHLFPSMWEWTEDCTACKGKGRLTKTGELWAGQELKQTNSCVNCQGTGRITQKSPFGVHQIKRDAIDSDAPNPIPPGGYIEKDIDPLKELKVIIEDDILAGYSSINMEILFKVGENQSGVAKTIDRQDFDSFMMKISDHVFDYQLPLIIKFVILWRYGALNSKDRMIEETVISKPKELSVLGIDALMEELKQASGQNVSNSYIKQLETEIVNTKFANNEFKRKRNIAVIELKAFPNRTPEQLANAVMNGGISKKDYIRNENIDDLVSFAIEDNDDFLDMSFIEKLEVINKIIDERYPNDVPEKEDKTEDNFTKQ